MLLPAGVCIFKLCVREVVDLYDQLLILRNPRQLPTKNALAHFKEIRIENCLGLRLCEKENCL